MAWHEKIFIPTITKTGGGAYITPEIANKYGLIPDNHHDPKWFKVVIMEHVAIENLALLVEDLEAVSLTD